MHAKVDQRSQGEREALFFAELPDPAARRTAFASPPEIRTAYGDGRKPNWPAILTIAALHVVLFFGLIQFDVIIIKPKAPPLTVIDIVEAAPPPAEKIPDPKPVPDKIVPQVVTPMQIVPTITPPPAPIAVAPPPQTPTPVVAAPSGPVTVGNLDEKMIEGNPPRYPMESRRKKEQGTVVLRLLIGADGRVAQVTVAESSGFDRLDQAALQAARNWRWQPMMRGGQPVEVRGLMTIPFTLKA